MYPCNNDVLPARGQRPGARELKMPRTRRPAALLLWPALLALVLTLSACDGGDEGGESAGSTATAPAS